MPAIAPHGFKVIIRPPERMPLPEVAMPGRPISLDNRIFLMLDMTVYGDQLTEAAAPEAWAKARYKESAF